ncbi:MAG: hypothetical protein R3322_01690 [Kiloniellales bacterium]|nr:hypothetical protein [Kiloniellales bacterium]
MRDPATALYAFCRMADDAIDVEGADDDAPPLARTVPDRLAAARRSGTVRASHRPLRSAGATREPCAIRGQHLGAGTGGRHREGGSVGSHAWRFLRGV